jgi:hypothetical protein
MGAPAMEDAATGGESAILNKRPPQAATSKHYEGFPIFNIPGPVRGIHLTGELLKCWKAGAVGGGRSRSKR